MLRLMDLEQNYLRLYMKIILKKKCTENQVIISKKDEL